MSYKYRLYPNATQKIALDRAMSIGWRIYNDALHQRICHYKETGKTLTWQAQDKLWGGYRRQYAELQVLPYDTVTQILRRLDKAYRAFFCLRSEGVGYPKSRLRKEFRTLEYRYTSKGSGSGCKWVFVEPGRAKLHLANIGAIKVHFHRPFPCGTKLKRIAVSIDKQDNYWASVFLEIPCVDSPLHNGEAVGID
jgi:putative transposase